MLLASNLNQVDARFGFKDDSSLCNCLIITRDIFAHEPSPQQKYRFELFQIWEKFFGHGKIPLFVDGLKLYFNRIKPDTRPILF
jgi:hypothetical protein